MTPDAQREMLEWRKSVLQSEPQKVVEGLRESKTPTEAVQSILEKFIRFESAAGTMFPEVAEGRGD